MKGEWIVRTYLAVLAAGFDRAFVYVSRDDCVESDAGACPTQFSTAGLATTKGAWVRKPAYDFVATFRSRLAAYAWLGTRASGDARVSIAAFKDPASARDSRWRKGASFSSGRSSL